MTGRTKETAGAHETVYKSFSDTPDGAEVGESSRCAAGPASSAAQPSSEASDGAGVGVGEGVGESGPVAGDGGPRKPPKKEKMSLMTTSRRDKLTLVCLMFQQLTESICISLMVTFFNKEVRVVGPGRYINTKSSKPAS